VTPSLLSAGVVACVLSLMTTMTAMPSARAAPVHVRIATRHHGPIHVWTPDGYDREHAGLVVYVHGYFADVDDAWREYRLAEQFARSGVNAMFIACEAPVGPDDPVRWTSLSELLATVRGHLDEPMPDGHVIVVGHSGAHRTITTWLDDDNVDTVVLLDALYGKVDELRAWVEASTDRRLIDVGDLTRPWTDDLHASLPETIVYDGFPTEGDARLAGARKARVVYVRSSLGHMPLVTGGVALPIVLRALRLPEARPHAEGDAP
jgi:hypothetical protein